MMGQQPRTESLFYAAIVLVRQAERAKRQGRSDCSRDMARFARGRGLCHRGILIASLGRLFHAILYWPFKNLVFSEPQFPLLCAL
jgi:hypothetical protein